MSTNVLRPLAMFVPYRCIRFSVHMCGEKTCNEKWVRKQAKCTLVYSVFEAWRDFCPKMTLMRSFSYSNAS